jgi:hypothetical protein
VSQPVPPDGVLPPLYRGERFALKIGPTAGLMSFAGKTVKVHLDSPTNVRQTIQGGDVVPAGDNLSVTASKSAAWTAAIAETGTYEVHVVIDEDHAGKYHLPFTAARGGAI